jgi:hypothetical protein
MPRVLSLPDLPALSELQGELERLQALVDERVRADGEASVALSAAVEADRAERIAAIREQREPAEASEPAARAASEAAAGALTDASAALDAAMADVRAQVVSGAPELLAAIEEDRAKARVALRKRLDATRQALAAVEEVEAVAAWLAGAAEGSVRPFSGGRPFQGPAGGREPRALQRGPAARWAGGDRGPARPAR